ncbi:hypothetical protein B0H11DRAFT_2273299 [Mycena galericulata]|nr:hypothetical protein B0H11DRAFT_2273299 [Mycena galericulata]
MQVARVVGAVKSSLRRREAAPTSPRLCIDFPRAGQMPRDYVSRSRERVNCAPSSETMYRVPASGLTSMRFIFLAALKAPSQRIAFPRAAFLGDALPPNGYSLLNVGVANLHPIPPDSLSTFLLFQDANTLRRRIDVPRTGTQPCVFKSHPKFDFWPSRSVADLIRSVDTG